MLPSIYLTGDTVEVQQLAGQLPSPDWRTLAMTRLQRYGLRVVNPLELTWSGFDDSQSLVANEGRESRVRRALELIDQCDALLANLERSSYATAMEMFYAFRRGKIVTVVGQSPFSPWVLSHSQARFGDIEQALDYIIEEKPKTPPINWSLQYEGFLAERYEQFPPAGEPDYKFLGGELPFLVLAPHATAFWREGEFQEPESFTGSLGALLNRVSGCHLLFSYYCCAADPMLYLETPLRRAFADIVKSGEIGVVMLLLGATWHEAPGLQLSACGPSPEICEDYVNRLKLKLSHIEPPSAVGFDTMDSPLVRFAAKEMGVTTIVLKLHRRYRMPRLQPEWFLQIARSVGEFIRETGTELLRSRA